MMQCPRCLNTDKAFFYRGSRGWYCRKCISFGRVMLEEENEPVSLAPVSEGSEEYTLQYPLTKAQEEIAVKCAELIDTSDVLLHCVCGAGKTELVVLSIAKMLKEKIALTPDMGGATSTAACGSAAAALLAK